ncbi:MAG: amino acid--tRNA ligase-related protein [Pseudomonadota bacterium]
MTKRQTCQVDTLARSNPSPPSPGLPGSLRSPWWNVARHADRKPFLDARTKLLAAVRAHFTSEGFTEVEPGILQTVPGNETHLHAFSTIETLQDGTQRQLHLHTSPEFACKKLLAAGERRIFSLQPTFRNRERGPLHAPEFTMLEWYRAPDDGVDQFEAIQQDCAVLLRLAAEAAGRATLQFGNRQCCVPDVSMQARRQQPPGGTAIVTTSVRDAILHITGVDIAPSLAANEQPNAACLADALSRTHTTGAHIAFPSDATWLDMFSVLMIEVEQNTHKLAPSFGTSASEGDVVPEHPLIIGNYPAAASPLASPCEDTRYAKRFELFACGVELANGFGENNDAAAVAAALEHEMCERERIYGERYALDPDLLAALDHLPDGTAGCALGFDRLVMLATGAPHIDLVRWTPPPAPRATP